MGGNAPCPPGSAHRWVGSSWSARPTSARVVKPEGKPWSGTHPRGLACWERLSSALDQEPVAERDRFFMAMLKPLGIEKGKPFAPDERRRRIRTEAAMVGEAMAKANTFDKRHGAPHWPASHWKLALIMDPGQRAENDEPLDERVAWFREAVTADEDMATKKVGVGSTCLGAYKARDGSWLDGGKSYRLRVPANAPARNFWSVTLACSRTWTCQAQG